MPEYKVLFKKLRTTQKDEEEFNRVSPLNIHDTICGLRRGLVVIETQDSKIKSAYTISSYYIDHDGEPGNGIVERDMTPCTYESIDKKLKTGKVLELKINLKDHIYDENPLKPWKHKELMKKIKDESVSDLLSDLLYAQRDENLFMLANSNKTLESYLLEKRYI